MREIVHMISKSKFRTWDRSGWGRISPLDAADKAELLVSGFGRTWNKKHHCQPQVLLHSFVNNPKHNIYKQAPITWGHLARFWRGEDADLPRLCFLLLRKGFFFSKLLFWVTKVADVNMKDGGWKMCDTISLAAVISRFMTKEERVQRSSKFHGGGASTSKTPISPSQIHPILAKTKLAAPAGTESPGRTSVNEFSRSCMLHDGSSEKSWYLNIFTKVHPLWFLIVPSIWLKFVLHRTLLKKLMMIFNF